MNYASACVGLCRASGEQPPLFLTPARLPTTSVLDFSSDPVLRLAMWAGLAAAACAGGMLTVIVFLRVGLLLRRAHELRLTALWRPVLAQCVDSGPLDTPRIAHSDQYFILHLWNVHHALMRGQVTAHLNNLLRRSGLADAARRMLRQGSRRQRLLAIVTLGNLREDSALNEFRLLADDASPFISLAAAQALLQTAAVASLPWLLIRVGRRQDWPLTRLSIMLREVGPDIISVPLADTLLTATEAPDATVQVPRLIKLLELAHPAVAAPAVRSALAAGDNVAVIASCVRALTDPRDRELACSYANHPAWEVRVTVAIALRRFAAPEDRSLLVDMLSDVHWWVRRSAADTLLALPFVTIPDLKKIQRILPDRYAADMLADAIAEQAV